MKDWMNRALKTFVQAFLGVLVPELAGMMKDGFPETGSALRVTLLPVVAASLAAAISAVWNLWLEAARRKDGR